jgi:hypothetical protein
MLVFFLSGHRIFDPSSPAAKPDASGRILKTGIAGRH